MQDKRGGIILKTLYLECNMGAAGDMLSAALLELHPDPAGFIDRLNSLGIPDVIYTAEAAEKCGIRGTRLNVSVRGVEEESMDMPLSAASAGDAHTGQMHEYHEHTSGDHDHTHDHTHDHFHDHSHVHTHDHGHDHSHDHDHSHSHVHRNLVDIQQIVERLDLPEKVKRNILKVYHFIAEAESHAHGRPVEEVHFHEVGAVDAVADITAFCLLMHDLAPDRVIASPVNVGFGNVRCAHGILPVPAPATAWILRDVPVYANRIEGELCTPTGAALLKCFAEKFDRLPLMKWLRIGIGCGKKDFEQANCVRAILGETEESVSSGDYILDVEGQQEQILELTCNLDDMTPEEIGFAMEEIMKAGALDVFAAPVTMKKSRPGIMLTCLCRESVRGQILSTFFRHTTTLGIREKICSRYTLARDIETLHTSVGAIRVKHASGWGIKREKYEYEDLAGAAREKGITLREAAQAADKSRSNL